ncbi:MAG TPA: hypothetical protein VF179_14220, partial [Thermoanaerobaculia bacterium]|nr:hypothetical protein [Thermoanaerobaculia bacterium]
AQVDYERAVLTVSMPGGEVSRQEFDSRQTPVFELAAGAKDGAYTWELRLEARIDASLRKALAEARKKGDEAAMTRLRAQLPESPVVSGGFMVEAGSILTPEGKETPGPKSAKAAGSVRNVTAADQVIPDDLIVQGSGCFGFDCVNNESFGFDTIRLKENNLRIKFEDTSVGTFPTNDWQLTANDSASGGSSKFSIEDITGARVPFTITAGASTNSIFVDSTGRVGFRTSTPVLDLHVSTSNTPAIRLEQTNAGGFTAQTWDIGANEANFFVRDVTGGSKLSFRIRPGAPTSSVDISTDGDVGIGTGSPEAQLHVFGSATEDVIMALGPNPDGNPGTESAFNIAYAGASARGRGTLNVRPDSNAVAPDPSLRFFTINQERMIITNAGSVGIGTSAPSSRLHVNGGDIRVSGGGFIDDGVTLNVPDYVFEPGYSLMPLAELESFVKENRHLPGVPNAGDVKQHGLNLSQFQLKLLEKVEELTLYVLAQKKEMEDLHAANAALAARLAEVAGAASN